MKVKLWSINRWLRWTGLVMFVGEHDGVGEQEPTTIGIVFGGWPPEQAWARHCERTRLAAGKPEWSTAESAVARAVGVVNWAKRRRAQLLELPEVTLEALAEIDKIDALLSESLAGRTEAEHESGRVVHRFSKPITDKDGPKP